MTQPWEGSTRRKRLPPNWESLRRVVLARDPTCQLRIRCTGARSTEVDHRNRGDDHSVGNLAGVCTPCHAAKTAAEAAAARGPRPTERRPLERHPGLTKGGGGTSPP